MERTYINEAQKGHRRHGEGAGLYREPAQQQVYGIYRAERYYRQAADHGGEGRPSPSWWIPSTSSTPDSVITVTSKVMENDYVKMGGVEMMPREHRGGEHRQCTAHRPQGDRSHQAKRRLWSAPASTSASTTAGSTCAPTRTS